MLSVVTLTCGVGLSAGLGAQRFAGETGKWGRGVSERGLGGLGLCLRARRKEGKAWWAGLVCSPGEFF